MAFDFPLAPVSGDIYTDGTVSYTWDGEVWRSGASALNPADFVKIVGDTMTGPLMLPGVPTQPLMATDKKYVDESIAAQALYQGTWQVAANVPDLDPAVILPLNGYSWLAQTVDPNIPEVAPAGLPGIGGQTIGSTDTVKWNANTLVYDLIRSASAVSALTIQDAPPVGAFNGQQWWESDTGRTFVWFDDGTSQQWVQVSGGGGGKAYGIPDDAPTDGALYGRQSPTAGTTPIWAPVSAAGGGIPEAPADGTLYARRDTAWAAVPPAGIADAPSDGQQYARQSAAWAVVAAQTPIVPTADAFPASPVLGQLHFLGTDASLYIWFGGAWVEVSAP